MISTRIRWGLALVLLPIMALACSLVIPASNPPLATDNVILPSATPIPLKASFPDVVTDEDATLIDLYVKVNPAVVSIITYAGQEDSGLPSGQGSGFLIDDKGNIVTNAHVVHGAEEIDVIFSDESVRSAELVGEDFHSDLAVVHVESMPSEIVPLPLGEMEEIAVGQTVLAIGNPFGLGGSLTRGIVSALGRTIPALTPFSIPQAIQTDAAINPGNSGGPLLNLEGEVIGVNAQIETNGTTRSNLGVGFAIPVSILERVIPELIENGEFEWAWLGVRGGSVTPAIVEAMNLNIEDGAYIAAVDPDGPSSKAGVLGADETINNENRQVEIGGDIITAIDDTPVNSFGDLLIYISLNTSPGQEVKLTILRDGETKEITLNMGKRPNNLNTFEFPFPIP